MVSCSSAAQITVGSCTPPSSPEHVGERDRVVDVGRGLGILAPLVAMLVGGELQGVEDLAERRRA
jgi:hypothetical protein